VALDSRSRDRGTRQSSSRRGRIRSPVDVNAGGIVMSKLRRLLSGLVLTLPLIVGYNFHVTAAKQASAPRQTVEKLPPDIHPDTLSRAARSRREDFTTDDEKKAFDEVMNLSPKQKVSRWLGETGTRLQIPELALNYQQNIRMLHEKGGLEPKY